MFDFWCCLVFVLGVEDCVVVVVWEVVEFEV